MRHDQYKADIPKSVRVLTDNIGEDQNRASPNQSWLEQSLSHVSLR